MNTLLDNVTNESAAQNGAPSRLTRVVTVASGKGGVGKTSVAINLAVAHALRGSRVLLLDADLALANVDVMLDLHAEHTLADVIEGRCELESVLIDGPAGIRIIPAASGVQRMADLGVLETGSLVRAFSDLAERFDLMIVDVAAGIHSSVTTFASAAHEVVVVVCDEPASIADAYALIKVLSRDHGVRSFRILANMVRNSVHGKTLYRTLARVAEQFLDVVLRYAGHVPRDEFVGRASRRRLPVVTAYPEVGASIAFKKLAVHVDTWNDGKRSSGSLGFFLEQSLGGSSAFVERGA